jgi:hypothetical protein
LNEDVLTKCEQKHPIDFLARMVCNGNVEKEMETQKCAVKEEKLIREKSEYLYSYLDIKNPIKLTDLAKIISSELNYKTSIVDSSAVVDRKVIYFEIPQKCDSGFKIYSNIHEDKEHNAYFMNIWRKDRVTNEETFGESYRLKEYEWSLNATKKQFQLCIDKSSYYGNQESCRKLDNIELMKIKYLLHTTEIKTLGNVIFHEEQIDVKYDEFTNDLKKVLNENILYLDFSVENQAKKIVFKFKSKSKSENFRSNEEYFVQIEKFKDSFIISNNLGIEGRITKNEHRFVSKKDEQSAKKIDKDDWDFVSLFGSIVILGFILGLFFVYGKSFSILFQGKINENFKKIIVDFCYPNKTKEQAQPNTDNTYKTSNLNNTDWDATNRDLTLIATDNTWEDFQSKNPFVKVYVKPHQREEFLNECQWLEKKLGNFPSETEQISIIKSLESNSKS